MFAGGFKHKGEQVLNLPQYFFFIKQGVACS